MPSVKKSMIVLAAAVVTAGYLAPVFADVPGESSDEQFKSSIEVDDGGGSLQQALQFLYSLCPFLG